MSDLNKKKKVIDQNNASSFFLHLVNKNSEFFASVQNNYCWGLSRTQSNIYDGAFLRK